MLSYTSFEKITLMIAGFLIMGTVMHSLKHNKAQFVHFRISFMIFFYIVISNIMLLS